jgi:hypothetical protein
MTDPFDNRLREKLRSSVPTTAESHSALAGLTPSLRRARRVRQLRTGLAGMAAIVVTAGAAAITLSNTASGHNTTVVAAAPNDVTGASTTDSPTTAATPTSARPTSIGAAQADISGVGEERQGRTLESTPGISPEAGPSSTISTEPVAPTSDTTTSPTASTSPSTTMPMNPSSSPTNTSATTPAGQSTIDSPCGSVVVSIDVNDLALIDVQPKAGFSVDQKDDGPETVEVSFEGPSGHCEITAEVRDGMLWTDDEDEEEEED